MNIPEKVKISWREYAVEQSEQRSGSNGGDLWGEISYEQNKIFLYEKLEETEKEITLLHEIIHGVLYFLGSELKDNENFVTAFTEQFYQVIKDNPAIFNKKGG